CQQHYSYTFTF
nr:immunoglobulin light chain junction region [Macaca mulatta]